MSESGRISYQPTEGLSYDPTESAYWDPAALAGELERAFEICHGCRMCFKYCDAFPSLFSYIDNEHDGDVKGLTEAQTAHVMGECFHCKLCEVQCPYTPRDGHEFQLDFPALVHRFDAVRLKQGTTKKRSAMLSDPDKAGALARASFGMANVMNRVKAHRWFLEKTLGIHRDKQLPEFAGRTFERWASGRGLVKDEPGGEAVLFQTCYVQHNEPEVGRDTVDVMEKNGVDLRCEKGLVCCGMPAWESGDLEGLRAKAKTNLDRLQPFVDAGAKVLVINPTCSMMLRKEWPRLLEGEDRVRATALAEVVRDTSEFLWSLRKEERFSTDFRSTPDGTVAYHAPCHLRAQAIGFRGRDLIRKVPGAEPAITMECCGHDGTYAMTVEGYEPSQRVGKKAFEGMQGAEAKAWVTDCPLAAIQFEQHAGTKPMHPMTLLARAYREDGFATKIEPDPAE